MNCYQLLSLEPPATPAKEQEKDHNQQDETQAAAAVVAKAGAHVVAAAAEEKKEDHENDDERHERESSTQNLSDLDCRLRRFRAGPWGLQESQQQAEAATGCLLPSNHLKDHVEIIHCS
jgi:TATA-binding protein-associated factor Taf7